MHDAFKLGRSVVDGELDLLCPKMELWRCPSYHETVMTGCGVIRANKRGELSFRLSGSVPFPFPDVFRGEKPQGTVYDIDDHVMLVALDAQGREWRSNPLLVHLKHPGEIVHGYMSRKIESLMYTHKWPSKDESTVRLYIPKQSQFPFDRHTKFERLAGETLVEGGWSIDHHVRIIGETEVTFRREEGDWLSVTAKQSTTMMPDWPGLMCHALSFATSGVVRPAVIVRAFKEREDIGLFSGPFHQYRSLMPRPIVGLTSDDAEAFWALVERVFMFAWGRRTSSLQFLEELDAIRAGAAMSIQPACLTLAIGIEALAKELLPAVQPPGWNHQAKAALESHIAAWQGDSATRDRVLGWLQSRGEPRAVDRLYAWATQQGVNKVLIDEWSALRNRRAHGTSLEEAQPSYDRYYAVVELLYRLIASAIGYNGQVLETSIRGWGQEDEAKAGSPTTPRDGSDQAKPEPQT